MIKLSFLVYCSSQSIYKSYSHVCEAAVEYGADIRIYTLLGISWQKKGAGFISSDRWDGMNWDELGWDGTHVDHVQRVGLEISGPGPLWDLGSGTRGVLGPAARQASGLNSQDLLKLGPKLQLPLSMLFSPTNHAHLHPPRRRLYTCHCTSHSFMVAQWPRAGSDPRQSSLSGLDRSSSMSLRRRRACPNAAPSCTPSSDTARLRYSRGFRSAAVLMI